MENPQTMLINANNNDGNINANQSAVIETSSYETIATPIITNAVTETRKPTMAPIPPPPPLQHQDPLDHLNTSLNILPIKIKVGAMHKTNAAAMNIASGIPPPPPLITYPDETTAQMAFNHIFNQTRTDIYRHLYQSLQGTAAAMLPENNTMHMHAVGSNNVNFNQILNSTIKGLEGDDTTTANMNDATSNNYCNNNNNINAMDTNNMIANNVNVFSRNHIKHKQRNPIHPNHMPLKNTFTLNNNPNINHTIIRTTTTHPKDNTTSANNLRSQHYDLNDPSQYLNVPLSALLKPRPPPIPSSTPRLDETNAIQAKTLALRAKNDEAIDDLRTRIPEIESIFDVHSRVGNGTFSTVLLGTLKKENNLPENERRKFAIKHHIPTSHPDRIMKELQCMAKMGGVHNVVGINCCIRYNESVAFIMPYMPHDRFNEFFYKMDLEEVQHYMRNLLIALRHVHKFNIIHRDVKPSNFLYNRRRRQFLLVDFGLAQQVFGSSASKAIAGGGNNITAASGECKRLRDRDEPIKLTGKSAAAAAGNDDSIMSNNDIIVTAKRIRYTGTNGDQQMRLIQIPGQQPTTMPIPTNGSIDITPTRVTRSLGIVNGTAFKMPLKQLNEISAPGKAGHNSVGNSIYETALGRQVHSAMLSQFGNALGSHKVRNNHRLLGGGANSGTDTALADVHQMASGGGGAGSNNGPFETLSNSMNAKYNNNRHLNITTAGKCMCYGNPQVCNGCLIKKEIHASRAGTPGYRPPEVLLKYPDQTTAVDIWAAGVIFLSILSSVYPFFKAPNDYVALAEMVTIFGDKTIRRTAFLLDRLVTLSQKTKPLDLRKLSVRFRNRSKFSSPDLLRKYQRADGTCEVCRNCDQYYFNCLCSDTNYNTEPLDVFDPFPDSAYDLLYRLLEVNPHKRITAEAALLHPFFSGMKKSSHHSSSAMMSHMRPTSTRAAAAAANANFAASTRAAASATATTTPARRE